MNKDQRRRQTNDPTPPPTDISVSTDIPKTEDVPVVAVEEPKKLPVIAKSNWAELSKQKFDLSTAVAVKVDKK